MFGKKMKSANCSRYPCNCFEKRFVIRGSTPEQPVRRELSFTEITDFKPRER